MPENNKPESSGHWVQDKKGKWRFLAHQTREVIRLRRSQVRMVITYGAGAFLFLGGLILMICLLWASKETADIAREVFTTLVPIATGVITYWFADQRSENPEDPNSPEVSGNEPPQPPTGSTGSTTSGGIGQDSQNPEQKDDEGKREAGDQKTGG